MAYGRLMLEPHRLPCATHMQSYGQKLFRFWMAIINGCETDHTPVSRLPVPPVVLDRAGVSRYTTLGIVSLRATYTLGGLCE